MALWLIRPCFLTHFQLANLAAAVCIDSVSECTARVVSGEESVSCASSEWSQGSCTLGFYETRFCRQVFYVNNFLMFVSRVALR